MTLLLRVFLSLLLLTPIVFALPRLLTGLYSRPLTYTVETAPYRPAAIVFGAGLWRDGSPTPVLRDRVTVGARLYFAGKVDKLVMSGGRYSERYDEPMAMYNYARTLGVPEDAIVLDQAGVRSYDTCYRARHVYGLSKALLITQNFHLPRAIYLCNSLGVEAVGVPSDLRNYRRGSLIFWNLREIPATLAALWEVHITRPHPEIGAPEPIFPMEAQ